ncbi:MAG TPA: lipase maturation factor family protein [Acidobacteriaceae bacterium]
MAFSLRYWFDRKDGVADRLVARWLFLRALGLVYTSVFYALLFQARGLIGVRGILPAAQYLERLRQFGGVRFWYAPTVLWMGSSDAALMAVCWAGLLAAVLVVLNLAPRAALGVCFGCFLSFIAVSQDFGQYQSDGMLLEAGFLSLFVAPKGLRPGWGERWLPARAAVLLLEWEWFRIYFESGAVKLLSGDPSWRNLTAMYEYYQNGPLPTWVGWYLEQLPHWFQKATAGATLGMELVLVWMICLPRRWRIACFCVVTVWQVGVIASANYAFLNYLVLVLAVWLLDDEAIAWLVPARWREGLGSRQGAGVADRARGLGGQWAALRVGLTAVMLSWIGYATTAQLVEMFWPGAPLPSLPIAALEPMRVANQYGLFAVMTPHRYEIEFEGSKDGQSWTAYPFRYKPQALGERPGIYAPYQPRFDWNLWFASLGVWEQAPIVPLTQQRLLENDAEVLSLFRGNPFAAQPPRMVRATLWQYWFATPEEKRKNGVWWRRELVGTYAPTVSR